MFRATVRASERTDVDQAVARLEGDLSSSQLSASTQALIANETRSTLRDLIVHGREIAALGSQMSVSRAIAGDGYSVTIAFGAGKRSLFSRLVDAVRGR